MSIRRKISTFALALALTTCTLTGCDSKTIASVQEYPAIACALQEKAQDEAQTAVEKITRAIDFTSTDATEGGANPSATTSVSAASSTSPSSSSTSNATSHSTGSSSTSSSSSTSVSGNTSTSEKPSSSNGDSSSTPAHTHSWVATYKTVNHEAVYETVYHDPVYKTVTVCKGCGEISPTKEHLYAHIDNQTGGGARTETIKVSDAWEETVCMSEAWSEQVVTGYTCSCGATKAA